MKKHIFIYICLSLTNKGIVAQTYHDNLWSRISISKPINQKWRTEAECQHRRQNDWTQKNTNIIAGNLLSSFRTWAHFQPNNTISLSISPFAYYWHNSIIVTEGDRNKPQTKELRVSIAAEIKQEVFKNLWLLDRPGIEYRLFNKPNAEYIRMRNRLGMRYEFNKKWYTTFYNEIFFNLKGVQPTNIFDHDRLAILINYQPLKQLRLETGYIYITRLPKGSDEFLKENNFIVHLYYTLSTKVKN